MPAVYFADTFWWIALANPKDAWHVTALAWDAAHPDAQFVTTEEVLSELLTWFAGTGPAGRNHASAADEGSRLQSQRDGPRIHRTGPTALRR
jgi:hypothetical protein